MQTIKQPHRRLLIKMTTIDSMSIRISNKKNCLCIIKLCIKPQILKNVNYVEINVRFYKQLVEFVFVFVFLEIYGLKSDSFEMDKTLVEYIRLILNLICI